MWGGAGWLFASPLERGTVGGDPDLGFAAEEEERKVSGGQLSSAPPTLPWVPPGRHYPQTTERGSSVT